MIVNPDNQRVLLQQTNKQTNQIRLWRRVWKRFRTSREAPRVFILEYSKRHQSKITLVTLTVVNHSSLAQTCQTSHYIHVYDAWMRGMTKNTAKFTWLHVFCFVCKNGESEKEKLTIHNLKRPVSRSFSFQLPH